LKRVGRRSRANSAGCNTTNVVPSSFHDTTSLVEASSTNMYVFNKNAGVDNFLIHCNNPVSLSSSISETDVREEIEEG